MPMGKWIVVFVVAGIVFSIVRAEDIPTSSEMGEAEPMGDLKMGSSQLPTAGSEEPMSIFNDEVRLFKFRIDHAIVDEETAAAFTVRYDVKENPPIIGAFPDAKTNALCVVGPPEAENAILRSLAKWIIEIQGIPGPPLWLTLRKLRGRRAEILADLANLEMALAEGVEKLEKQQKDQVQDRLKAFQAELIRIEKQIEIGEKYLKRIQEAPM